MNKDYYKLLKIISLKLIMKKLSLNLKQLYFGL
jgi:hypothetical protein